MQHYFICTIHFYAILNKSKNATLQYFIFCEKELDKKYLLKCFPDMKQAICRNSTNLSLLMSKLFKALSLNFAITHAQKDCYVYQNSYGILVLH